MNVDRQGCQRNSCKVSTETARALIAWSQAQAAVHTGVFTLEAAQGCLRPRDNRRDRDDLEEAGVEMAMALGTATRDPARAKDGGQRANRY